MPLLITSKWLWLSVLAILVVNLVAFWATRATLSFVGLGLYVKLALTFGGFWICLLKVSQRGKIRSPLVPKLQAFCEGMLFMCCISVVVPPLNHLTMMIPVPFQDDLLAGWDESLGFNWVAYFEWVHGRPMLISLLDQAYVWLSMVGLLGMTALIFSGDWQRTRFYMDVFFYTAVICVLVGALFPAMAAVDRYILDPSAFTNFPEPPGVYHIPYFDMLRDSQVSVLISPVGLPGLVTFPSYHTASGVLLAICFFRTWMFWPMSLYSITMIASTPVFGGHYFVDIFAGALFAIAAVVLLAQRPQYRGVFGAKPVKLKRFEPNLAHR